MAAEGKVAGPTVTQEASVTFRREKSAHAQRQHPMETRPTNTPEAAGRLPVLAQAVAAPLTRAAIFLVATLNPGPENRAILRSFCGDLAALVRAVEFRDLEGGLSCVMGFGSDAWNRLFGPPRPAELHPFREIRAGARHAVSTPGDLLFHIRAKRMDLCFELALRDSGEILAGEDSGYRAPRRCIRVGRRTHRLLREAACR